MKIVTSAFAGAEFPPGTIVSFMNKTNRRLQGTIQKLYYRYARVLTQDGSLWNVPYGGLVITKQQPNPEMTLTEIEILGNDLIHQHEINNKIQTGWKFAFDLAPTRAGICRYDEKQITLSVTYCQKATKEEIVNTILHEIAHAIVGPKHGHDAVWKATARDIGCNAERCHRVKHTAARWRGECGCGKQWTRQRLSQRARTGVCPSCENRIIWIRES